MFEIHTHLSKLSFSLALAPTCQPNWTWFDSQLGPKLLLHLDCVICVDKDNVPFQKSNFYRVIHNELYKIIF